MYLSVKKSKRTTSCVKKDYIWNLTTYNYKNGKYLVSIIDDSVIMSDEITEETKNIPKNFNEKDNLQNMEF